MGARVNPLNVPYVLDEKQLTEDLGARKVVMRPD